MRILCISNSSKMHELYRLHNPMREAGFDYEVIRYGDREKNIRDFDLVYLKYLPYPHADVLSLIDRFHAMGKKVAIDVDDDLLSVDYRNPVYVYWGSDPELVKSVWEIASNITPAPRQFKGLSKYSDDKIVTFADTNRAMYQACLIKADFLVVSTPVLLSRMKQYNNNVFLYKNALDMSLAKGIRKIEHPYEKWMIWSGGTSHLINLEVIRDAVCRVLFGRNDVRFIVIGFPSAREVLFPEEIYTKMMVLGGSDDTSLYLSYIHSSQVALAPLTRNAFNSAKSPIRIMESIMCGTPVIASPTVYGKFLKKTRCGPIARTTSDWVGAINKMLDSNNAKFIAAGQEYIEKPQPAFFRRDLLRAYENTS